MCGSGGIICTEYSINIYFNDELTLLYLYYVENYKFMLDREWLFRSLHNRAHNTERILSHKNIFIDVLCTECVLLCIITK